MKPVSFFALIALFLGWPASNASSTDGAIPKANHTFSAAEANLRLCMDLLSEHEKALFARADRKQIVPHPLEVRILKAEAEQQERMWEAIYRRNHGFNPIETAVSPRLHPVFQKSLLENTSADQINALSEALKEEGGELRVSRIGGYFRAENGLPILCLPLSPTDKLIANLFQVFLDWRNMKNDFLQKGKNPKQAALEAFEWLASPRGILVTQTRAKSAELFRELQDVAEVYRKEIEKPSQALDFLVGNISFFETLIFYNAFPYVEHLKQISHLRKNAQSWKWKFTTFGKTRISFFEYLDKMEKAALGDLADISVKTKKQIVSAQLRLAEEAALLGNLAAAQTHDLEAIRLQKISLLEQVLAGQNLQEELQAEAAAFQKRIQDALSSAEIASPPVTPESDAGG